MYELLPGPGQHLPGTEGSEKMFDRTGMRPLMQRKSVAKLLLTSREFHTDGNDTLQVEKIGFSSDRNCW